jgi:hypothetical protein
MEESENPPVQVILSHLSSNTNEPEGYMLRICDMEMNLFLCLID